WRFYRWRPLTGHTSLTDRDGYLYNSIQKLMDHGSRSDIKAECRQQIETVLRKNINLAYVDLHMCIPAVSGVMPNKDYELELMDIVCGIADEYQLPYSYKLNEKGNLTYFDSGLSISSKDYSAVDEWLSQLKPGIHHLSCHCAVDSAEQANLAHPQDHNYHWALTYRRADTRLLLSNWFIDALTRNNITIVKNLFSELPELETYSLS